MGENAPGRLLKKSSDYIARIDGDALVVTRGAKLRGVCFKCASHKDLVRRDVVFTQIMFLPPTVRRAPLGIPLCASCNHRWSWARAATAFAGIAFAMSLIALFVREDHHALLPLCFVLFVGLLVTGFAYARPRMLTTRRIDDQFVELNGCHANAAQEIAEGSVR